MDEKRRTEVALWRLGVLGPLVSAELKHGDLRHLCEEAAARVYRHPDGRYLQLRPRTIEGWHYAYQRDGLAGLEPGTRADAGRSRAIPAHLAERLVALKRENPRRSIRRLIRMLERAGEVRKGTLKRSTVHRLLQAHNISRQPARSDQTERRAFRHRWAGDCWMGDVMHGPRALDEQGRPRKTYLHAFVDSAVRFVPGCSFRFGEKAVDLEAVLKHSLRVRGLPRMLYLDNGSAQKADSLRLICGELKIHLRHARPYDPQAKAGVERFFRTWRAEVGDELPDDPLPIVELNALSWAWLSTEYHRRVHQGTGRIPLEHWLEQAHRLRAAPRSERLDEIFLHREQRLVRRDSTVRYAGRLLEVRGELAGGKVELRFDPHRPLDPKDRSTWPTAWQDNRFVCDTVLLDPVGNSTRRRRRLPRQSDPDAPKTHLDPLRQMADEQAHQGRLPMDLAPADPNTPTDDDEE